MAVSICAIMAVRNEVSYLAVILPLLAQQGIDVVIIDNDSSDGSQELYSEYRNSPIIAVENLAFTGSFSLSEQLKKKMAVYETLTHDWLVHHDADEVLDHCLPHLTLRDAIQEADDGGYNAINFEEMTFIPESGVSYRGRNYYKELLQYYFFQKHKGFLNRAWKRSAGFRNDKVGGHILQGENIELFPLNHILRHYIVLDEAHAIKKYSTRVFEEKELGRGWHKDRAGVSTESLILPLRSDLLFRLNNYQDKKFIKSNPALDHYWHWG